MKKIGLIDYYISEWHANNYPDWIKEINQELGFDYEVTYFWAEKEISPVDNVTSNQWSEKMKIAKLPTIEELCELSDVIIILAPSNPEKHLKYAKVVLPFKKRTYIDKTFAPNLEEAKEIFEIAEKYGTPFFSTSALRYSKELKCFANAQNLEISGGGSNFEEYIIHLAEMTAVLIDDAFEKAKIEAEGETIACGLKTYSGDSVKLFFGNGLPFGVKGTVNGEEISYEIKSDFFKNLIADILKFFESGDLPFDAAQTLKVMQIRDLLLKAEKSNGEWVTL